MTRHDYQKRFGDFATAKEQEDAEYSSLESAHLNKPTKRGACSGLDLVANAPRRGESASAWLDRQINMLEKLDTRERGAPPEPSFPSGAPGTQQPSHQHNTAMAYIHGMRHAVSILEYYEDFTRRREGGEVEAWEDLAA